VGFRNIVNMSYVKPSEPRVAIAKAKRFPYDQDTNKTL
jgi:hypothetical protein